MKNQVTHELDGYYDTIAQAAAVMGVPVGDLKAAKAAGCPGFKGARVHPGLVSPWMKENAALFKGGTSKQALECRRLLAQCIRIEHASDVEKGRYLLEVDVREEWSKFLSQADAILKEIPVMAPQLVGRTAADIEKALTKAVTEARSRLHGE